MDIILQIWRLFSFSYIFFYRVVRTIKHNRRESCFYYF